MLDNAKKIVLETNKYDAIDAAKLASHDAKNDTKKDPDDEFEISEDFLEEQKNTNDLFILEQQ